MSVFDRVLDVLPHYLGMVLVMLVVVAGVRAVAGDLGFWIELGIAMVIAFSYPPVVRRLGIAPRSWHRSRE